MTEGRIIYNPSESVMKMFYRKMNAESREELKSRKFDAVGLLQTTVRIPVYAIGGISSQNMESVRKTGAAGACIMSGFMRCKTVEEIM